MAISANSFRVLSEKSLVENYTSKDLDRVEYRRKDNSIGEGWRLQGVFVPASDRANEILNTETKFSALSLIMVADVTGVDEETGEVHTWRMLKVKDGMKVTKTFSE